VPEDHLRSGLRTLGLTRKKLREFLSNK